MDLLSNLKAYAPYLAVENDSNVFVLTDKEEGPMCYIGETEYELERHIKNGNVEFFVSRHMKFKAPTHFEHPVRC